jgi:PBP1b-binding outer membrane lipoprotein LpoB
MKIIIGIFFYALMALGCNKSAAPAASTAAPVTENKAATTPSTPPDMQNYKFNAEQQVGFKKIEMSKLKMLQIATDTTVSQKP